MLAAVFPIVILTVVVEGRRVHPRIRRFKWHSKVSVVALTTSVLGLAYSVVGVQLGGFDERTALPVWGFAVISLAALTFIGILLLATAEADLDVKEPTRWHLFKDFVRGKRS